MGVAWAESVTVYRTFTPTVRERWRFITGQTKTVGGEVVVLKVSVQIRQGGAACLSHLW